MGVGVGGRGRDGVTRYRAGWIHWIREKREERGKRDGGMAGWRERNAWCKFLVKTSSYSRIDSMIYNCAFLNLDS